MAITFDAALGIHEKALMVRAQRAQVLANNLVNADTPNFKAQDLDFKSILAEKKSMAAGEGQLQMSATQSGHNQGLVNPEFAAELMYRTPLQPSVDGNTVDAQTEMATYAKNAMDFQTSFMFLNRKFSGLSKAITGQ